MGKDYREYGLGEEEEKDFQYTWAICFYEYGVLF